MSRKFQKTDEKFLRKFHPSNNKTNIHRFSYNNEIWFFLISGMSTLSCHSFFAYASILSLYSLTLNGCVMIWNPDFVGIVVMTFFLNPEQSVKGIFCHQCHPVCQHQQSTSAPLTLYFRMPYRISSTASSARPCTDCQK